MRIIPLAGFDGAFQFYLTRAPAVLWSLRRAFRAHHAAWDVVWILDVDPYAQAIHAMCIRAAVPSFLYLRARYDLLVHWQHARGLRKVAAFLFKRWLRYKLPQMARTTPVVLTGSELRQALVPEARRTHVWVSTVVREKDLRVIPRASHLQEHRILVVGRVAPGKGIAVLLEALALLKSKERTTVRIVGPTLDWHVAELQGRASALGLQERVTFTGAMPYGPRIWAEYQMLRSSPIRASRKERRRCLWKRWQLVCQSSPPGWVAFQTSSPRARTVCSSHLGIPKPWPPRWTRFWGTPNVALSWLDGPVSARASSHSKHKSTTCCNSLRSVSAWRHN